MRHSLATIEQLLGNISSQLEIERVVNLSEQQLAEAIAHLSLSQLVTGNLPNEFASAVGIDLASLPLAIEFRLRCAEPLLQKLNQLPLSSPELVSQIRESLPQLLRVMLTDTEFPKVPNSLSEKLLDRVYFLANGINPKDPGCIPLAQGLEEFLQFLATKPDTDKTTTRFIQFSEICDKQLQRCQLLEKRRCEAESGQHRLTAARQSANALMECLCTEDFSQSTPLADIRPHWQQLMFLLFLKSEGTEWQKYTELYQLLIISFSELEEKADYEALKQVLPKLVRRIRDALSNIGLSGGELESLMGKMADSHKRHLQRLKAAITGANDSADIIRLKPTSPFAAISESSEEDETASPTLSPKHRLLALYAKKHESVPARIKQLFRSLGDSLESHDIESPLTAGSWYLLPVDICPQAVKLVKIFDDGQHYFVFVSGNKAVSLAKEKVNTLFEARQLIPLAIEHFVEQSLTTKTSELATQLGAELAALSENETVTLSGNVESQTVSTENDLTIQQQNMTGATKEESQIPTNNEIDAEMNTTARAELLNNPKIILQLAVGSWINYQQGDDLIKCRLAAKIRSGQQFVFTNRQGMRVLTLTAEQIVSDFATQKLTLNKLSDIASEKGFQSMISSMREMKKS